MSTHPVDGEGITSETVQDEIQYEVSTSDEVINLVFRSGGETFSVSTDPRSALLLASDIRAAVDNTPSRDDGDHSQFVFEN